MADKNRVELKALSRCGTNLVGTVFPSSKAQAKILVHLKKAEYFTRVMPEPNNADLTAPPAPTAPPPPPAPSEQPAPPPPPPPPAKATQVQAKGKGKNKNTKKTTDGETK